LHKAKNMPKHRVFESYGRDEDGKQTRTVHSPGGNTHVGKQTFATTPTGNNQAWLFMRPGVVARRKDDAQSTRDARTKAKHEIETGKRARVSLAVRAESLGVGSAEGMKPKALSQVVLRAELSAEDQVALNERRKDLRAEQTVQKRDALNASQKAYKQVIMYMYSSCTQHLCAWLLGVFPTTQINNVSIF
jgi:hypothetical protein